MNVILKNFNRFKKDEQGSVLPMIAVVLILVIMLGAVNFALVVMYRDRTTVRNALDAGITSSLAAVAKEEKKAIYYGERSYCSDGYWRTNKKGKSRWVCTERTWVNTESNYKNYVQLNVGLANGIAKHYFEENMDLNNLDYNIKSWNYSVTYDDERIYTVKKNRNLHRSGSGIVNNVTNPPDWWLTANKGFSGASTGDWEPPEGWTEETNEEREVLFPRWVEVKANVKVELPVPFGKLVGRSTYTAGFDITAFKELIEVIE